MIFILLFCYLLVGLDYYRVRSTKRTLVIFSLLSVFFFTIIKIPLADHYQDYSEVYWGYYYKFNYPLVKFFQTRELPLFFAFFKILTFIFKTEPGITLWHMRILMFFILLIAWTRYTDNIFTSQAYNGQKDKFLFMFLCFFLYFFDYNTNLLLIGDQFRNFLSIILSILFLDAYTKKNWPLTLCLIPLNALAHKIGVVFPLFYLAIDQILQRMPKNLKNKSFTFIFVPLLTFALIYIGKMGLHILGDKRTLHELSQGVHLGLLDGFFLRKGVLAATALYFCFFFLAYREFDRLRSHPLLFTHLIMAIMFWSASKYGVLFSDDFVGPNRFYFYLMIFFSPIIASSEQIRKKNIFLLLCTGYFFLNFLFKNYSVEARPFIYDLKYPYLHELLKTVSEKSSVPGFILLNILSLLLAWPALRLLLTKSQSDDLQNSSIRFDDN